MITITPDPSSLSRLAVTQTITVYLDKLLTKNLLDEIAELVHKQAIKDLKSNPEVKKVIAEAATNKLLEMLGVKTNQEEKSNADNTSTPGNS
jgi:hypothetical protein